MAGSPPSERAAHEVANGFRQFDLCLDMAEFYLDPERPFSPRVSHVLDLQRAAVDGIENDAGKFRTGHVAITHSSHVPPGPHLVQNLMVEFCDYINDNWHEKTVSISLHTRCGD